MLRPMSSRTASASLPPPQCGMPPARFQHRPGSETVTLADVPATMERRRTEGGRGKEVALLR